MDMSRQQNESIKAQVLRHDTNVPRYTSYPTAPHFQDSPPNESYTEWLRAIPENGGTLSLYLHIPFCPSLCWYCGCNTKITRRYEPVMRYIDYLIAEIALTARTMHETMTVSHIHFGGGSPTILKPEDFTRIIQTIHTYYRVTDTTEIAVEVDPRAVDEHLPRVYAANGVNRISLGVQDFDEHVLAAINRHQPPELTRRAIALFRAEGISQFNFDMLYGLPKQTLDSMAQTINTVITLAPDRICLYGYAHVPWKMTHMRMIPEDALPDTQMRYDLNALGHDMLRKAGYDVIGIDHFARTDDSLALAQRNNRIYRNFQGYTDDDAAHLIGVGLTAISGLAHGYSQNAKDMGHYMRCLDAGELPVVSHHALSAADRLRGDVIEKIMCNLEADIGAICQNHGYDKDCLDADFAKLKPLYADGLLEFAGKRHICIPDISRPITRVVAAAFDAYLNSGAETRPQHARAV